MTTTVLPTANPAVDLAWTIDCNLFNIIKNKEHNSILRVNSWSDSIFISYNKYEAPGNIIYYPRTLTKVYFYKNSVIESFFKQNRNLLAGIKFNDPEITISYDEQKDNVIIKRLDGAVLMHPTDVELAILKIFVEDFKDPNDKSRLYPITEILAYNKCDDLRNIMPKEKCASETPEYDTDSGNFLKFKLCNIVKLIENGNARPEYVVARMTYCEISLDRLIINSSGENLSHLFVLMSYIFQVLHTLYRIKKKYPKFRHGDLHTGNVLVRTRDNTLISAEKKKFFRQITEYDYLDDRWRVPKMAQYVKIIDFGFSELPERSIYNITRLNPYMKKQIANDENTFLHSVYTANLAGPNNNNLTRFLQTLDPTHNFIHLDEFIIEKNGQLTAEKMINAPQIRKLFLDPKYQNETK